MSFSLYVEQKLKILEISRVGPNRKYWILAWTCDKNRGARGRRPGQKAGREQAKK